MIQHENREVQRAIEAFQAAQKFAEECKCVECETKKEPDKFANVLAAPKTRLGRMARRIGPSVRGGTEAVGSGLKSMGRGLGRGLRGMAGTHLGRTALAVGGGLAIGGALTSAIKKLRGPKKIG